MNESQVSRIARLRDEDPATEHVLNFLILLALTEAAVEAVEAGDWE